MIRLCAMPTGGPVEHVVHADAALRSQAAAVECLELHGLGRHRVGRVNRQAGG